MLGDLPSIVPRRNYDIRTQCLKGTCSSSELPGRWHVPVLDDACPCRGCSSMFSPEASTWKGRLRVPLLDQIHCFGFPDRADDGVRTRGFLLGKQACYHCTTSAWPCFFRIRRTAVTYSPPAERGMAGLRVGLTGFEPATPCSQSTCATKLRHNPLHRYESRTAHHCFLGRFELRLWFPINVSEPLFHPALPVVADAIFLSADRWLYTTTRNRMLGVVFHQAIQPFIPAGTSIPAS